MAVPGLPREKVHVRLDSAVDRLHQVYLNSSEQMKFSGSKRCQVSVVSVYNFFNFPVCAPVYILHFATLTEYRTDVLRRTRCTCVYFATLTEYRIDVLRRTSASYCSSTPGITTIALLQVGEPGQPREPPRPQPLGTISGIEPRVSL